MSDVKCFYLVNNEQVSDPDKYELDNKYKYTISSQKFAISKGDNKLYLQMLQDIHFNYVGTPNTNLDIYLVSKIHTGNGQKNRTDILDYFNKEKSEKYNVKILFNFKGKLENYNKINKSLTLKPILPIKDSFDSDTNLSNELNTINLSFNIYILKKNKNKLYACNPSIVMSTPLVKKLIGNYLLL